MCSRFELSSNAREIMAALELVAPPGLPNKPEVRPTDQALIVTPRREGLLQPWGLTVDWSKQPMINARAETLTEKSTFRPLLEHRCALPASAYFEWRRTDSGKKLKNRIFAPESDLFALAGLTDGKRFTVVTCQPAPAVQYIHDRMPVILTADGLDAWLSDSPFGDVKDALVPYLGPLEADEETPEPPKQADLFG